MTFTETLHPRGQAANAGQFRAKSNDAPTSTLAVAPSPAFAAANDQFLRAQGELRREAVREMLRAAPAGTERIVFELYSEGDPDAEMLAFSHFTDADHEEIETSRELSDYYYDLASRIDHEDYDEYGFTRDGAMFVLDVASTDPAVTAPALEDAIQLHRFVTFNGTPEKRAETDEALHTAAANHIRAIAGKLQHPVDSVVLDWGEGGHLWLVRTEDAAGNPVHDSATFSHPSHAADRPLLDEISFTASNIRNAQMARLTHLGGHGRGPFKLTLNP